MNFPQLNLSAVFTHVYGPFRDFDKELVKILNQLITNLANAFANNISVSDNLDCQIVTYSSNVAANTEDTVAHSLKRVPTGYFVAGIDKAGVVYNSGTAFTATNIYLKCSQASAAVTVVIF